MRRFAEGDDAAFRTVYTLAAPHLRARLLRLCNEPALADDLLQDTFLRMHRARRAYRKGAEVLPWASAIARRLFLDRKRQRQREARLVLDVGAVSTAHGALPPSAVPADDALAAMRSVEAIERALAALPPLQAEAFRLVKEEGLSAAEAADRLGVEHGAMRLRIHRALRSIRRCFDERRDRRAAGAQAVLSTAAVAPSS